jgi:hypothetical protein
METRVEKHRSGWSAKTLLDLPLPDTDDGTPKLRLSTYKDGRGRLNTYAGIVWVSPGWERTRVFKDFHKLVLSEAKTVTEKAVRIQHDAALKMADSLVAEAAAFQTKE